MDAEARSLPPIAIPGLPWAPEEFKERQLKCQAIAKRYYPALGVAGSGLNTEFLTRYQRHSAAADGFFKEPDWPVRLTKESVLAVGSGQAESAAAPTSTVDPTERTKRRQDAPYVIAVQAVSNVHPKRGIATPQNQVAARPTTGSAGAPNSLAARRNARNGTALDEGPTKVPSSHPFSNYQAQQAAQAEYLREHPEIEINDALSDQAWKQKQLDDTLSMQRSEMDQIRQDQQFQQFKDDFQQH